MFVAPRQRVTECSFFLIFPNAIRFGQRAILWCAEQAFAGRDFRAASATYLHTFQMRVENDDPSIGSACRSTHLAIDSIECRASAGSLKPIGES